MTARKTAPPVMVHSDEFIKPITESEVIIKAADPDLEKLLAEEEQIEKQQQLLKMAKQQMAKLLAEEEIEKQQQLLKMAKQQMATTNTFGTMTISATGQTFKVETNTGALTKKHGTPSLAICMECGSQGTKGYNIKKLRRGGPTKWICSKCSRYGPKYRPCCSCQFVQEMKKMHQCSRNFWCTKCFTPENHRCSNKITTAPWIARGHKTFHHASTPFDEQDEDEGDFAPEHQKLWGFIAKKHIPHEDAADYYLLVAARDGLLFWDIPRFDREDPEWRSKEYSFGYDLQPYQKLAGHLLERHVEVLDQLYCAYIDMVVGGELRYHQASHAGTLRGSRAMAWIRWKAIRDTVGIEAIKDAAAMFRDMPWEGTVQEPNWGYGGEPWAQIADALYLRLTNVLSPELFVDRVFNLQHNGGTVLNKVEWKNDQPPTNITAFVGPAHAAHPTRYNELTVFASKEVRSFWTEYIRAVIKERQRCRLPRLTPEESRVEESISDPSNYRESIMNRLTFAQTYGMSLAEYDDKTNKGKENNLL